MGRNRLSDHVLLGAFTGIQMIGVMVECIRQDMREADTLEFEILFNLVAQDAVFNIEVTASEDINGVNEEVIKSAIGFVPSNPDRATVDVHAADLPDGKPWVGCKITETGAGGGADVSAAHLMDNLHKKYGNRMAASLRLATWE